MKKGLFILLLSILLIGCSNVDSNTTSNNESSVNEKEDKDFIEELEDGVENYTLKYVYDLMINDFDKLESQEDKDEAIEIYNKFVSDNIDSYSPSFFMQADSNKLTNNEYLDGETKDKIIRTGNPIYILLSDNGLKMELNPEYSEDINVEKSRPDIISFMDEDNIDYKFISDKPLSSLIVLNDNTVIEFSDSLDTERIFKIIDNDGNVQDPQDILGEFATKKAEEENERQKKASAESEIAKEDNSNQEITVTIGMTKEEVIDIKGKPKKINRTTTANNVSEQWVYRNSYLYFDDGILTTISD